MKKNIIYILAIIGLLYCIDTELMAQQKKDNFQTQQINTPYLILNGYSGNVTLKKEVLLDTVKMTCSLPNCKITTFDISMKSNGTFESSTFKNGFIDSQWDFLKPKSGYKFYIEKVKAKTSDGKIISIKGMTITIE